MVKLLQLSSAAQTIIPPQAHKRAWLIFSLCGLFYFYQALLQVSPDVIGQDLRYYFSVSNRRLGLLSAAFFFSYMLMQIPAGILIERFGPRRLLILASATCAISTLIFALAPCFTGASLARLGMGFGAAFIFSGSCRLFTTWFSPQRFTAMIGLLIAISTLGAINGEAPLMYLVIHLGWRNSMLLLGGSGFILSLLIFMFIQDHPSGQQVLAQKSTLRIKYKLLKILKHKQLWLVAIFSGLLAIPTVLICSLYGIPFLRAKYALSNTHAANLIELILIGQVIGSPLWGALSDYYQRRKPPLIIAAIMIPLILTILIYGHTSLIVTQYLLFIFGLFATATLPAYSIAREINRPEYSATTLGFVNTIEVLLPTVMLPFTGHLLDIFWDGAVKHQARVYNLADYQSAWAFAILLLLIPLILLLFIKDTYAKQQL